MSFNTFASLEAIAAEQAALTARLHELATSAAGLRNEAMGALKIAEQDVADAMEMLAEAQGRVAKYREILGLNTPVKAEPKTLLDKCRAAIADPVGYKGSPNINLKATAEKHGICYTTFGKMVREHHLLAA